MPEDLEIAPWLPPEAPPMAEAVSVPVPQPGRRMTGYAETFVPAPDLESPAMQLKRNAAIADIYANSRNFQEAEQAVVSAIRWMEFRQIENEIKNGTPAELAYAKHPRAFLTKGNQAPSSVGPAYLRALKPPPTLRTETAGGQQFALYGNNMRAIPRAAPPPGPIQASPMLGPDGRPVAGVVSVPGARGNVPFRLPVQKSEAAKELTPAGKNALYNSLTKAVGALKEAPPEQQSILIQQIEDAAQALKLERQVVPAQVKKAWGIDAFAKDIPATTNYVPRSTSPPPPLESKPLTEAVAREFLKQAGGDKNKARALAREAGYEF